MYQFKVLIKIEHNNFSELLKEIQTILKKKLVKKFLFQLPYKSYFLNELLKQIRKSYIIEKEFFKDQRGVFLETIVKKYLKNVKLVLIINNQVLL